MAKRVFLMDDSAFALDLLRTALADDGISVRCGRDLADLAKLKGEPVDLVLMDVEMPEAFGDDLTTWLLGEGLTAPVYLVSSLPPEQLAVRARECGAQGFISKATGIDAVVSRVHEILNTESRGRSLAPTLLISDFLSMAAGRMRRAELAISNGALTVFASELHTLAGEAGLLGLAELARLAEECHVESMSITDKASLSAAASLSVGLAAVSQELVHAATRARVPTAPPGPLRTGRLLLLDDSDLYRSTLMGLLEDAGYVVVEARRLAEARHRMREGHFDLAILDLQLEDGSGSDLIPELRQHAPNTRLLLLSGQDAKPHNADLMLPKSIDPAELLERIDELVRPGSATPRTARK